jgi:predicted DCC family thiol-disulfide oxidoreductase YuxK
MATVLTRPEKRLIFDGDCPMCRATIATLLRLRLVRPEQTVSNHDLDPTDRALAEAAGLHNELVVLDPETHTTRRGADALLWIIGDNTRLLGLVWLLGLPGFRQVLRYGYQTVSYNRRIISPPRHQIVCDCEPEVTRGRRMSLVAMAGMPALVVWGLFGAAAFVGGGMGGGWEGAVVAGATLFAACAVLSAAALAVMGAEKGLDYVAHLSVTTCAGALVLAPGAIAARVLPREMAIGVTILSLVASVLVMFRMQRRRTSALGAPSTWLYAWGVANAAAIACAAFYAVRG